jgi:sec-independent protein translocase protein TatC
MNSNFGNYLKELKLRLAYSIFAISLTSFTAFAEKDLLFFEFTKPLRNIENTYSLDSSFIFLQVTEAFNVSLELAILVGILLNLPFFWLQLWFFLSPTFYNKEQKIFNKLLLFSLFALASAISISHQLLLPKAWTFFLSFGNFEGDNRLMDNFNYLPGLNAYLKIAIQVYISLLLTSQFPLFLYLLLHWQWLKLRDLLKIRSWILLFFLIWAALITPPDLLSLILTFFPFYSLYEAFLFFLLCSSHYNPIEKTK